MKRISNVKAFITSFTIKNNLKKRKKIKHKIIPNIIPKKLSLIIFARNQKLNQFGFYCCNQIK